MKNFWNSKKVLITGASGFIGYHMVHRLNQEGAEVTAVVSSKMGNVNDFKDISVVEADLENNETCLNLSKGKDIILNFAALDGGAVFKSAHPADIFQTNTQITLNLLEAAHICNIERILLMSSIMIYPKNTKSPVNEDDFSIRLFEDTEGYVWSKRFTEIAARMYASEYKTKIGIVRSGNIYGQRDNTGIEKGRVIPTFIRNALEGKEIPIIGNGTQKRSFLFIDDLIEGLLSISEHYVVCDPVNIASEQYISLTDLAKMIIKKTKSKSKIVYLPSQTLSNDLVIDIDKAKKIIKFHEQYSLEEGLQKTIDYFKTHV